MEYGTVLENNCEEIENEKKKGTAQNGPARALMNTI